MLSKCVIMAVRKGPAIWVFEFLLLFHYVQIWLASLETQQQENTTHIYVNDKLALVFTKNSAYHDWSKHIDTRYHFIRERVTIKDAKVNYTISNCRHSNQAAQARSLWEIKDNGWSYQTSLKEVVLEINLSLVHIDIVLKRFFGLMSKLFSNKFPWPKV